MFYTYFMKFLEINELKAGKTFSKSVDFAK